MIEKGNNWSSQFFYYAGFICLHFKIIDQPRGCLSLLSFCTSQAYIL
jgi:hypothetical protein